MKPALLLALPLLLMAARDAPPAPYALATLNVQQGGTRDADGIYRGGVFKLVDAFIPPADHGPRDALIAFEGPGWESDKVAYRLYLDERNVPDIYGKRLPGPVLPRIGQGKDDYHTMADWGQDILQVNQSLGAGGIGVWRGGKATQLGPSRISATLFKNGPSAGVAVDSNGFAGANGTASMTARYSIMPGSRITNVEAEVRGSVPAMVAGLVLHPGTVRIQGKAGGWRYIATWGVQSLAKDNLGLALFYPANEANGAASDGETFFIRFCDPRFLNYAFGAVWVQEPGAPKTEKAFRAWLDESALALSNELRVVPEVQRFCSSGN